jgi:hypothetical protein
MKLSTGIETELDRWQELLQISREIAPDLIPILERARQGGMRVKRYRSGRNVGALYISLSATEGADYSRWDQLNCGPGLEMYMSVQAYSKARWDAATNGSVPSNASSVHQERGSYGQ